MRPYIGAEIVAFCKSVRIFGVEIVAFCKCVSISRVEIVAFCKCVRINRVAVSPGLQRFVSPSVYLVLRL